MTFRVGQKVVCVNARGAIEPRPVKGRVYTVASVRWVEFAERRPGLGITLVELPTIETDDYYAEYFAWRFRPIVERKTDIGFAQEILRKVSRKDRASA